MLRVLILSCALLVGCVGERVEEAPSTPTAGELTVSACEDLHAAHLAMCQRCGIAPPRPAGSSGAAWKYADCAEVTAVRDEAALYDTCLPALATGCYEGDTPPELGCHQFEF